MCKTEGQFAEADCVVDWSDLVGFEGTNAWKVDFALEINDLNTFTTRVENIALDPLPDGGGTTA